MRSFFLRGRAAAEPQNPPCGSGRAQSLNNAVLPVLIDRGNAQRRLAQAGIHAVLKDLILRARFVIALFALLTVFAGGLRSFGLNAVLDQRRPARFGPGQVNHTRLRNGLLQIRIVPSLRSQMICGQIHRVGDPPTQRRRLQTRSGRILGQRNGRSGRAQSRRAVGPRRIGLRGAGLLAFRVLFQVRRLNGGRFVGIGPQSLGRPVFRAKRRGRPRLFRFRIRNARQARLQAHFRSRARQCRNQPRRRKCANIVCWIGKNRNFLPRITRQTTRDKQRGIGKMRRSIRAGQLIRNRPAIFGSLVSRRRKTFPAPQIGVDSPTADIRRPTPVFPGYGMTSEMGRLHKRWQSFKLFRPPRRSFALNLAPPGYDPDRPIPPPPPPLLPPLVPPLLPSDPLCFARRLFSDKIPRGGEPCRIQPTDGDLR